MRILKKNKDISNEKYSRAYYFNNDILKISVERFIEITIINTILRDYLNFMKKLFNALIR